MLRTAALSVFLLPLWTAPAPCAGAPPEVTPLPSPEPAKWTEVKVPAGRMFQFAAQPASTWELVDESVGQLFVGDKGAVGTFLLPEGRHRVKVTGPTGETARLIFVAGDPPKPPTPPDPPAPDALKARLAKAYADDAAAEVKKHEQAKDLAALYRQAADLAGKPEVATAGDLLARVKAASTSLVGTDALKGVRGVVAAELGALLPTDAPLSDAQRKSVAALFAKLAAVLEGF